MAQRPEGIRFHGGRSGARRLAACASLLMALAAASPLHAATSGPQWLPVSPDLGTATALAFDPAASGRAFASGADGEVLRSDDHGATWHGVGVVPAALGISSLAVVPGDPPVLYAAAFDALYRSPDGGASWVAVLPPEDGSDIPIVAVSPSDPQTLYIGGNPAAPADRVRRSSDGGATWTSLAAALPVLDTVKALATDPADSAAVYLGTDRNLWLSRDGGSTWSNAGASFATGVDQIVVDPRQEGRLFVLTFFVYRSDDGGVTWTSLGAPPGLPLSLALAGSGTLYCLTDDGAVSAPRGRRPWRQVSSLVPALDPLAVGLPGGFVEIPSSTVFAADPGSGGLVAGVAGCGLLYSPDGAAFAPAAGSSALIVSQLLPVPAQARGKSGRLFAVTTADPRGPNIGQSSITVADVGGESWRLFSFEPGGSGSRGFFARPCLAFDAAARVLYAVDDSFIFESADSGVTWSQHHTFLGNNVIDIAAVPGQVGSLLELQAGVGEILTQTLEYLWVATVSDNGGSTVQHPPVSIAIPPGNYASNDVPLPAHLLVDPADSRTLYIAATALWKSIDGGAHLDQIALPGPLAAAAMDPSKPQTLYAAIAPGSGPILLRSSDGGASWRPAARQLPAGATATALAVDPASPATVYLASDQGVFVSHNHGGRWVSLNRGLEGVAITTFGIVPGTPLTSSRVYAGSDHAGIFLLSP